VQEPVVEAFRAHCFQSPSHALKSGVAFFFRDSDRRRRDDRAVGDDVGFVLDDPLDDLALLKLHGLGHGGREVDVVLVGSLFAGDELDFGWVSHG